MAILWNVQIKWEASSSSSSVGDLSNLNWQQKDGICVSTRPSGNVASLCNAFSAICRNNLQGKRGPAVAACHLVYLLSSHHYRLNS